MCVHTCFGVYIIDPYSKKWKKAKYWLLEKYVNKILCSFILKYYKPVKWNEIISNIENMIRALAQVHLYICIFSLSLNKHSHQLRYEELLSCIIQKALISRAICEPFILTLIFNSTALNLWWLAYESFFVAGEWKELCKEMIAFKGLRSWSIFMLVSSIVI